MKVLVTGANGYIGSKVVSLLCDRNHQVIATDFFDENIDKRAIYIKADLFEKKNNWFVFFGCPDICLDLAWRDGFIHNSIKHMSDLSGHFYFAKNLMDFGLKRYCGMGTMHEIGYWEGIIDENTPCNPLSQYGISKNALRKSLELYSKDKKCEFLWLRAFYIYGNDLYGNSIFCKIRQAVLNKQEFFPFTSGKNKYDFIHIDDLAVQIVSAILQNEVLGIINCCSGKAVSLSDQVEWYIKQNNLPIRLEYGTFPDRKYDSPCIYGDNKKINLIIKNGKNG